MNVHVPVELAPADVDVRTSTLELARDEIRRAVAQWESDGSDERSCDEVVLDTLNALIVRRLQ